ncbi:MAG: GNAT family N-acetyltransferase [Chloroflexota bacterium]
MNYSTSNIDKLLIRKANHKDISSIVKVRKAAFTSEEVQGFTAPTPSIFYSSARLEKAWQTDKKLKGGWNLLVAENNKEVIGFIVFKIENEFGYIDNINVARTYQGKSVGRALVSYVEQITKSQGISVMKTDTTENAQGTPWKSYAFWTKMGYKDTGERFPTKWAFKEIHFIKTVT